MEGSTVLSRIEVGQMLPSIYNIPHAVFYIVIESHNGLGW